MKCESKIIPQEDARVVPKKKSLLFLGVAVVLCLLLYGWFSYAVRFGLGRSDEAFYLTLPQRLSLGDRFILHEWFFSQFSAIFQYLHYKLFVDLTGSTEGIILHFRYTFLAISFLIYWAIIYFLRKTPLHALAGAFLFCGFVPFAIFAPNYYNLTPFLCLLICFILTGDRGKFYPAKLFLCGVVLSVAVLLAPTLTLLYVLYTVFALIYYINKRKGEHVFASHAFLLEQQIWVWITVGVAVCAAVFLLYLGITCGFGKIIQTLPNLFNNSEYSNPYLKTNIVSTFFSKIGRAINLFHPINAVIAVLLLIAGFFFEKNKNRLKHTLYWKTALLSLSFLIFISSCVFAVIQKNKDPQDVIYWWYHSFCVYPIFFLCLMCYYLCSNHDPKKSIFWQTGFFLALFRDFFSNVSLGIGCILSAISLSFYLTQVLHDIRAEFSAMQEMPSFISRIKMPNKRRSAKKAFYTAAAFMTICLLCWNTYIIFAEGMHCYVEKQFPLDADAELTEGPYKGIRTKKTIKETYDAMLSDMKQIKAITKPEDTVYVTDICPLFYLYLEQPYAAYSSWFVGEDVLRRQIPYWQLYPEKLPSVIYVPTNNFYYYEIYRQYNITEEYFKKIENYITCNTIQGAGGEILVVKDWNL